jgi:hypothetical protein
MPTRSCPLVVKYNLEKKIPDIEVDVSNYKNCQTKLRFKHKLYGEYYSTYNRAMRQGGFHPKVVFQIRKKTKLYDFDKAQELLSTLGLSIKKETYVSFGRKCTLIDKEYGEWEAVPSSVFKRKGKHPKRASSLLGQSKKLTEQEINEVLKDRNISIIFKTYLNASKKATFVDPEYGEWSASFLNVVYNKSSHPARGQVNRSLSTNRRVVMKHWRTDQNLVCVGSYECFFVEWLNKNKIDFKWQVCFNLSNGKRYFIDCYLPEFDIYLELKGREMPDWKEKWQVFTTDYLGIKASVIRLKDLQQLGYVKRYHELIYFKKMNDKE